MNQEQFEIVKLAYFVDDFMTKGLEMDNLTMADYMEFMPKILPQLLTHTEKEPVVIFETLMHELESRWTASPNMPFHGPWHHGIIPAVLVLALYNNNNPTITKEDVSEAFTRGLKIPAGSCGFSGTCGGGAGVGIAVSVALKATPFHNEIRAKVLESSIESLKKVKNYGGPRCCRMSSYIALETGPKLLNELNFTIPYQRLNGFCEDYEKNNECHTTKCPYYAKNKKNMKNLAVKN